MFRERVEPRSTAGHQERPDGGCSRARAGAVRLQRNAKQEERRLSPEGPRGQASCSRPPCSSWCSGGIWILALEPGGPPRGVWVRAFPGERSCRLMWGNLPPEAP